MKLKKIASLLLAGVMAMSMLAGCAGSGDNANSGSDNGSVVDTSLTGQVISALSDDTTDKVAFTSSASLGATLQKAIDNAGAKYDELKNAGNSSTIESWMMQADTDLDNKILPYINDNGDTTRENNDKKEQSTFGVVVFDGQGYSVEYAVKQLAAKLDAEEVMGTGTIKFAAEKLPTYTNDYKDGYYYSFKYTGTMSVVAVSDAVTGQTVYIAAYTITRTPTKVSK